MYHTCHAEGCNRHVLPRFLMCPEHWKIVPRSIQSWVYATYRPGQEIDKRPSEEYIKARNAAITAVANIEKAQ
jgi:hypothetical protein